MEPNGVLDGDEGRLIAVIDKALSFEKRWIRQIVGECPDWT